MCCHLVYGGAQFKSTFCVRSSLFCRNMSDKERKAFFHHFDTRRQCYKTFLVRELRIFALSQSVYQTRLEKLTNDKHSRLLQKYVIYGQKSLITLAPGAYTIKQYGVVIYGKWADFVVSQCLFYRQLQTHQLGQTHQLTTELQQFPLQLKKGPNKLDFLTLVGLSSQV